MYPSTLTASSLTTSSNSGTPFSLSGLAPSPEAATSISNKHFGGSSPSRQKKWIDYDERLQKVVENYDDYTIFKYLQVVGSLIWFLKKIFINMFDFNYAVFTY